MRDRGRPVLVDTNTIIEAHRTHSWRALSKGWQVETVGQRRFGRGASGLDRPGGTQMPNGGVGVGVEHGGLAGELAVMDDLEGPVGRRRGFVAQHDGLADEEGVDLVETSVS